ncbi:MAG: cupin domain-containing protein [Flexilinea sp.]
MIKKIENLVPLCELNPASGSGALIKYVFLSGDECPEKIEFVVKAEIQPNSEVGQHTHKGNGEIWFFLKGKGEYSDNDKRYEVGQGDMTVCYSGNSHGVKNVGGDVLEYLAVKFID